MEHFFISPLPHPPYPPPPPPPPPLLLLPQTSLFSSSLTFSFSLPHPYISSVYFFSYYLFFVLLQSPPLFRSSPLPLPFTPRLPPHPPPRSPRCLLLFHLPPLHPSPPPPSLHPLPRCPR